MKAVFAVGLLILASFEVARPGGRGIDAQRNAAGNWDGVLFIDSVGHVPRRPVAKSIRISITLAPVAPKAARLNTQIARPTHVGTATGNFKDLNTGLQKSAYPVHAMQKSGDSLVVAINPMVDHGSVILTGPFDPKSFRGSWKVTDYAKGLSGHFELKRREELVK